MVQKIYKRIGIRRDRNLSDLSNTRESLNNLLDALVDDANSTFISEDLNVIRNIFAYGLDPADYSIFAESAVKVTNSSGIEEFFSPSITYQNRLDRFRVFSGEPRIFGGNGLTARYFDPQNINQYSQEIFSGQPFKEDQFWEQGNFSYTGKIVPESVDSNGGVLWEGFFIPTQTGSHTFRITSTGCFTFDFQKEGYISGINTYTEISRVGIASTFAASGTSGTNQITLSSASNTTFVGIGQSVSAAFIRSDTEVTGFNRSTGVITLESPSGNAVTSTSSGNVTFYRTFGQEASISYSTHVLTKYDRYRIRFRYFVPEDINATNEVRSIDIGHQSPTGGGANNLRYNYLYSLNYDFNDSSRGDINEFLDTSILSGGGEIGGTSNSNDYVKVISTKKVDIKYEPKTSVSGITRLTVSGTISNSSNVLSLSDTSNLEIGNYVFGTGIPDNTRITDIDINQYVLLSNAATSSGTYTMTFINHRGFIKRATGSSSGSTFTLSSGNTSDLKTGMILIGNGAQAYTGITTTGSASSFTISPSQTISSTNVYFYQSRGLINNSLDLFCLPSSTRCLIASSNTSSGASIVPVTSTTGISNGWYVYGFQFEPNTTIVAFTSNSITLSDPTIRNLVSGSNFTVSSSTDEEKGLCCPPTDTSPPFNPTLEGLETVSGYENLKIDSGDILFDSLTAVVSGGNISNYVAGDTSGSRLNIQTPSGTYKILCA